MKLVWDEVSKKFYETGDKKAVLYVQDSEGTYPKGVAWSGITAATVTPSGAEPTDLWADDTKYLTMRSAEKVEATIEAYTYPDEFEQCDGYAEPVTGLSLGQQGRRAFGFVFVSTLGNDVQLNDYGYKIHILYNCTASPSERGYKTINDSPEAITFSWSISTTPVNVTGYKPTAYISINSTKANPTNLKKLEDVLFGSETEDARLPLPDEVISILEGETPVEYSITLSQDAVTLAPLGTASITATTVPADAAVSWASSDEQVATVEGGTIAAVANGTATVTATITGTTTSAQVAVTVTSEQQELQGEG